MSNDIEVDDAVQFYQTLVDQIKQGKSIVFQSGNAANTYVRVAVLTAPVKPDQFEDDALSNSVYRAFNLVT